MKSSVSGGSLAVDLRGRRASNLAVLQKLDPSVLEIIGDATHVALYNFVPAAARWERMDIEGACFVTRGTSAPFYNLVVLNKNGPDDFKLDIKCIMNIKVQPPYLMLRHATAGAPNVVGLWFHNDAEQEEIKDIISRTMASAGGMAAPGTGGNVENGNGIGSAGASGSGKASSQVEALKKLLASPATATARPTSVIPASPASSTQPAPAAEMPAGAKLLVSLKAGASKINSTALSSSSPSSSSSASASIPSTPNGESAHVFLTDREIAARHNSVQAVPVARGIEGASPVGVNAALALKLKNLMNGGGSGSSTVTASDANLTTSVLASSNSRSTPAAESRSAPPTPGAQRIPVSALFAKAGTTSTAATSIMLPTDSSDPSKSVIVPLPTPAPAPAPSPVPVAAVLPTAASPAPKLMSPSDLLGAARRSSLGSGV